MSMDLVRSQGGRRHFCLNNRSWRFMFQLAIEDGWEPAGTLPPEGSEPGYPWDAEDYFSNAGQEVTAADALALAAVLGEKTLPRLAVEDQMLGVHTESVDWGMGPMTVMKPGAQPTATEWWSGPSREDLLEFVAFLLEGAFRIC